jgi:predicted dehydrogenase
MKEKKQNDRQENQISRRDFLGKSAVFAAGATAFTIVPRHVVAKSGATPPSDKLNIAGIGALGKGYSDIRAASTENIVALVDVDDERLAQFRDRMAKDGKPEIFEKAKKYRDFRKMLDEMDKSIDAVTVSTPDHTHAVAAAKAMKMGKHAFVQKPLTHTIYEARYLAKLAKDKNVVTQMGNQGHAGEGGRLVCEWIWDGAIGEILEAHCWTNRPIWPQGIERPKEIPSVPSTLDYNLWLGPAPFKPYHPACSHFNWRGWWDYGTGAIGDMGAHILDHAYWALKLDQVYPTSVQATSTPWNEDSYPVAEYITWEFPARGNMPPVTLHWYDGGLKPMRPLGIEEPRMLGDQGGGVLFVGSKGHLMCSVYGNNPRIIPETKMKAYTQPPKTIPRSPGIMEEWIQAIKEGKKSTTDFSYSAKVTETMLLGNFAVRFQDKNTRLFYDGENMKITNLEEANNYFHFEYRPGWEL